MNIPHLDQMKEEGKLEARAMKCVAADAHFLGDHMKKHREFVSTFSIIVIESLRYGSDHTPVP